MTSFFIGKVMEPEIKQSTSAKGVSTRFSFGVLSGKNLPIFDIWDNDSDLFQRAATALKDGMQVCVIISDAVDKSGRLKSYVKDFAPCPDELRDKMKALFKSAAK